MAADDGTTTTELGPGTGSGSGNESERQPHPFFGAVAGLYLGIGLGVLWSGGRRVVPSGGYVAVLVLLGLKIVTGYSLCTVAWLECKVRRVKRGDGYLNRFLDGLLCLRNDPTVLGLLAAVATYVSMRTIMAMTTNADGT